MVTHIARVWLNRVRMVANPARGKLNRKMNISLFARACEFGLV